MTNLKSKKIAFWIVTVILSLGMLGGGLAQLFKAKPNVEGIVALGYPIYLLTILGIWKLLAVFTILIPKYPLVKEWAYAGLLFLLSGGVISHLASGDPVIKALPVFAFLCLTVASWYLRPAERKITINDKK